MSLEQLQPAPPPQVGVYVPYYPQAAKRSMLPLAIGLYQKGVLEGQRKIEGGESIPFIATWNVSTLPARPDSLPHPVSMATPNSAMELMLANFEFIDFLIDVVMSFRRSRLADFSQTFYRKLLRLED